MALYDDRYSAEAAFMGADPREDHVAKLLVKHFTKLRNGEDAKSGKLSSLLEGDDMKNFLEDIKASNYTDPKVSAGDKDKTIHPDVVDSIIDFAIFHKELDKTTGNPSLVSTAITIVQNIINRLSGKDTTEGPGSGNKFVNSATGYFGRNLIDKDDTGNLTVGDKGLVRRITDPSKKAVSLGTGPREFKVLNNDDGMLSLILVMAAFAAQSNNGTTVTPNDATVTIGGTSLTFDDFKRKVNTQLVSAFARGIKDNSDVAYVGPSNGLNKNTALSNLSSSSFFDKSATANVLTGYVKGQGIINEFVSLLEERVRQTVHVAPTQSSLFDIMNHVLTQKETIKNDLIKKLAYMEDAIKGDINTATGAVGSLTLTAAKTATQDKFFNEIIGNWNKLEKDERTFYNEVMGVRINKALAATLGLSNASKTAGADGMVNVTEQEFSRVYGHLNNTVADRPRVRINLLKRKYEGTALDAPVFISFIPDYNNTKYDGIVKAACHVGARRTTKKEISLVNKNDLRDIYMQVYVGKKLDGGAADGDLTGLITKQNIKVLAINTSRNIRARLGKLLGRNERDLQRQDENVDDSKYLKEMTTDKKFTMTKFGTDSTGKALYDTAEQFIAANGSVLERVPGSKSRFMVTNKDGKKEEVEIDTKNLCKPLSLQGTVGARETAKCAETVQECLMNDDVGSLNKCLGRLKNDHNFANAAYNEIRGISPAMAVRLLQRLGFKAVKEDGQWKVQSVNEWETRVKRVGTVNGASLARNDITTNDDLKKYLAILVHYVNANPAVLNSGYKGPAKKVDPVAAVASVTKIDKDHREALRKLGFTIASRPTAFTIGEPGGTRALASAQKSIQTDASAVAALMGLFAQGINGVGRVNFPMMGGASVGPLPRGNKNLTSEEIEHLNNKGSVVLREMINGIKQKLLSQNKTLANEDEAKIEKHLVSMKKAEEALANDIKLLSEYYSIVDQYGDSSVEEINTAGIDLKQIRENLEKTHNKLSKEARFLLAVVNMLGKAGVASAPVAGDGAERELSL